MPRAKRRCSHKDCDELQPCPDHTRHAWEGSDRSARLPSDWRKRRALVRERAGGRCEAVVDGQRCPEQGSECDHIQRGDDHDLANLAWLCAEHHRIKTLWEAAQARRAIREQARRPPERHPGLA